MGALRSRALKSAIAKSHKFFSYDWRFFLNKTIVKTIAITGNLKLYDFVALKLSFYAYLNPFVLRQRVSNLFYLKMTLNFNN